MRVKSSEHTARRFKTISAVKTNLAEDADLENGKGNRGKSNRWFFLGVAAMLIILVAVGFARTFYLPRVLEPRLAASGKLDLPFYIVLHGIVLTAWFLLLFTQALLVSTKRVSVHRKLGIAGAALAVLLVPLSFFVVTRSVARSNLGALAVIGDYGILALFAVLVTLSIRSRRKPDVHKRLMLIASICLVAPAIARWPGAEAALPFSVVVPQLTMLAALMAYDIITRRRVHAATGWGIVAYFVVLGVCVPLAMSDFGHQLVRSLK